MKRPISRAFAIRPFVYLASALALLAVTLVEPGSGAPASSCDPARVVSTGRGWTSIRIPELTDAGRELTTYAVDPERPARMFATNGTEIARSLDGGCSWSKVLSLSATPSPQVPLTACVENAPSVCARITSLALAPGQALVYAIADVDYSRVPQNPLVPSKWPVQSRVLVTEDDGATWRFGDNGLPAGTSLNHPTISTRPVFAFAPSAPRVAYAYAFQGGVTRGLYVSNDAALTWKLASVDPVAGITTDLAVDPADPNVLWRLSNRNPASLERSMDGGVTWKTVEVPKLQGSTWGAIDIQRRDDEVSIAVSGNLVESAATVGVPTVFVSHDSGRSWATIAAPDHLAWVERGTTADSLVVMTQGGQLNSGVPTTIYRLDRRVTRWVEISPNSAAGLDQLSADRAPRPSFYARTNVTIEKYSGKV